MLFMEPFTLWKLFCNVSEITMETKEESEKRSGTPDPGVQQGDPLPSAAPVAPAVQGQTEESKEIVTTPADDPLSMLSGEELLQMIQNEEDKHEEEMSHLRQRCVILQEEIILAQQALAKEIPELLRLQDEESGASEAPVPRSSAFHTGCPTVDYCLEQAEVYVKKFMDPATDMIGKLCSAASSSMQQGQGRYGFTVPAPGAKSTGVVVLFHPSVRGVRQWANSHISTCRTCAGLASVAHRQQAAFRPEGVGLQLMPSFAKVPGKRAFSLLCRILQQPGLHRRSEDEMFFTLCRFGMDLTASYSDVSQSPDQMARNIENFCNRWLNRLLSKAVEDAKAVYQTEEVAVKRVAPAVEMFLHSLIASAEVKLLSEQSGPSRHRDPADVLELFPVGPAAPKSETRRVSFHLQMEFSTPLHVSALAPFLDVVRDTSKRHLLLFHILQPVLLEVAKKFGGEERARPHLYTALSAVEALWTMMEKHSVGHTSSAARFAYLQKWYFIFQAFAAFATTLHVEWATPSSLVHSPQPDLGSVSAAARAASSVGRYGSAFARAVLRFIAPPPPPVFPPAVDAECVELAISCRNAPSALIGVLSLELSPASSQPSLLDVFFSKKTQINIGLKMYSEFCVDIYRPFHASTGVRVSNKGVGTSTCQPRVDLPANVVAANLNVAQAYEILRNVLQHTEERREAIEQTIASTFAETSGVLTDALSVELKESFETLGLVELDWDSMRCDALLPLHQFEVGAPEKTKNLPLLYASFKVSKNN